MSDGEFNMKDIARRMDGAVSALKGEFNGLRTGRASAALLDPVTVEVYGQTMPLNQLASISVPEPQMLTVQVWDKTQVAAVDKALRESGLGLNPATAGQLIRVPMPSLTEERRVELSRQAAKYAEQARVAVRNVRRGGMDQLKRMEKDGTFSKDEHRAQSEDVQSATNDHVRRIDDMLAAKEEEIMQV